MAELTYPTSEKIIEYNLLAINLIRAKKGDKAEVLSRGRLESIIKKCRESEGDVFDKAVALLVEIVKGHPFASGNRRTAFIVTKTFLMENGARLGIKDDPAQAKVMTGIREGFYSDEEIRGWIRYGKIRSFER